MGVLDWFKRPQATARFSKWNELGKYNAVFTGFGSNMYKSDLVRSCIRPLSEHTSKANAVCNAHPYIERLLNVSPNYYMNGKDFLAKVRTYYELKNTAFIYILRDDTNTITGFYPVPYSTYEALEYNNGLFIKFYFTNGRNNVVLPWEDLAVLRKDYNESDIAGDDNAVILNTLDLINTTNQGIANAVKSTANLRGILKSTKAMLKPEDVKAQRDMFVNDYMNIANEGGIASIDATMDFTPITMNPQTINFEQMKEFRENVYRYFGINDNIIKADYTEEQMEAFYESRIEPFLVALSVELTKKVFTPREYAFGSRIVYESNRMQYASNKTKLNMIQLVDRGILTPNELRFMFNLEGYEGGDEFIRRLDTATTGDVKGDEQDAD